MEINTRMAGGSFKATAVGCDFASLALKIALNETIDTTLIKKNFQNKCLGNIEQFIDLTWHFPWKQHHPILDGVVCSFGIVPFFFIKSASKPNIDYARM